MKLVRILLPIDQGGTSAACAKAALTLAERFSAELEVLHPCLAAWQRLPYATELSPYYFQELINTGSEQVAFEKGEAKTWCDRALKSSGVAIEFCSIEGLIGPTVAMRARVSDFTVLPTIDTSQSSFWSAARDAALFDSGKPLLAVPEGASSAFGETVVIAWKDNGEATRAVSAAKPFLAAAKRVRLIAVTEGDEEDDQSLPAMADYLGRAVASRMRLARCRRGAARGGEFRQEGHAGHGRLWSSALERVGLRRRHTICAAACDAACPHDALITRQTAI